MEERMLNSLLEVDKLSDNTWSYQFGELVSGGVIELSLNHDPEIGIIVDRKKEAVDNYLSRRIKKREERESADGQGVVREIRGFDDYGERVFEGLEVKPTKVYDRKHDYYSERYYYENGEEAEADWNEVRRIIGRR